MSGGRNERTPERATHAASRPAVLSSAMAHLRRDPLLFVPFLVVGIFLSLVDWFRLRDPIPAFRRRPILTDGIHVRLEFAGYPTGVSQTTVPLESLVDLQVPYLVWSIGLYVLPLLAVTLAGAFTIARAARSDSRSWLAAVVPLFAFVIVLDLTNRVLASIDLLQGMGLWGLPLLVLYLLVMVRLFLVPGLVVTCGSLWPAVGRSDRLSRGLGWNVFGVILVVGLGAMLLASVPVVGTILSSALVAPLHATAIVAILELDPERS